MGIVENLLKEGKISPLTIEYISEVNICETFGWTLDYVRNLDVNDLGMISAVLSGRNKGMKDLKQK